jgi:hypothetical protein
LSSHLYTIMSLPHDSSAYPATTTTSPLPSSAAKPKRVRRPNHRRPKALPATIRQRLAVLGHNPKNSDTTDANLSELIEQLSGDLQNYSLIAQHWQNKLVELQANETRHDDDEDLQTGSRTERAERAALVVATNSSSSGPISTFEYDLLNRLKRGVCPTLEMVNMPAPRVRMRLVRSDNFVRCTSTDEAFLTVLTNVSGLANMFGMFKGDDSEWSAITKLKPDFTEHRAREIWQQLFDPIDTDLANFQWESASSCRAEEQRSIIDFDDGDYDSLDRRLMIASDFDVVDMLHYCSLLLIGFNQAIFEDYRYMEARDHLGKQVERLLREAIFSRNIGANREYAQGLLAGILGVLRHFSVLARSGAVVSLLEIAWATCMQHVTDIHPIMKGVVSFVSTVLAPSQSRRSVWMARNQENFQSTTERYFHLTTTAYFTASYYALTTRDEDALLHYLAQLDEILAPRKLEEYSAISGPFYEDPGSCFRPIVKMPTNKHICSSDPRNDLGFGLEGCKSTTHSGWAQPPTPLTSFPSPSSTSSTTISETALNNNKPTNGLLMLPVYHVVANSEAHAPNSSATAPLHHSSVTGMPPHHLMSSQFSFSSSPHDDPVIPDDFLEPILCSNLSSSSHLSNAPTAADLYTAAAATAHPSTPSSEDSPPSSSTETTLDEGETSYVPNEDFKSCLRAATHLIRAEAALLTNDYPTCRYWVDEAEREMGSVPDVFLHHKVFLVDVSVLKSVFTTSCPFPSGTRSIPEEFEHRILAESERRRARFPHRSGIRPNRE